MKLNHDFYTFSPKHYRELSYVLTEYPEKYKHWTEYFTYIILPILALMGKISVRASKNEDNEAIYFIKFWPKPKFIPLFLKIDKSKLVDEKFRF